LLVNEANQRLTRMLVIQFCPHCAVVEGI